MKFKILTYYIIWKLPNLGWKNTILVITIEKSNKIDTNVIIETQKHSINDKWLIQKGNNCRYNAFITIFYFAITPYLKSIKDRKYLLLDELNERVIKLSGEVNDINYINIVIFLQKNKFYSNNAKTDAILNEQDEEKKRRNNKTN